MDTHEARPRRPEERQGRPCHVCPWWMAYTFDNLLRRMLHPPRRILGPYLAPGMCALDFGCGFGHYALGMARMVGESGRVFAADVQRKMLDTTMARARKAGLDRIILPLLCDGRRVAAPQELDFALASNSLHETPDPAATLAQLFSMLKPGCRFLLLEPRIHLSAGKFAAEIALAKAVGFLEEAKPTVPWQFCALFRKPPPRTGA